MPDFSIETNLEHPVIGLDEVGRGPLAGQLLVVGAISRVIKSKMNSKIILEIQKNYLKKKERCPLSFFKI